VVVFLKGDKTGAGLNGINQGFEASLFHPDFGNEVVNGRIFIDRWKLQFRSDLVSEEISMDALDVQFEADSNRIYFQDPNRPELKIFTSDQSVFKHPAMRQCGHVQAKVSTTLGKREAVRALRLTLYFILGCVGVTWFCSIALSFMVRAVASGVPMAWEEKFGQEEIDKLRKDGMLIDDTNQIAQLTELAQPLIKVLPENRRNLKFFIKDDEDPNAFALPGEFVVVHKGLLEMVETPEELLGVLAHELAHETQRHVIRHKIAAAGSFAVFGVFIRGKHASGGLLGVGSGVLVFQGFSQGYETEADAVGWKYMVAANINPQGMIDVFKKLKAQEGDMHFMPQSLSSHPALSKRIATLEKKWKHLDRQSGFLEIPPVKWEMPKGADERPKIPFSLPPIRPPDEP
jgi:Zn-dependent protease with chaperone function